MCFQRYTSYRFCRHVELTTRKCGVHRTNPFSFIMQCQDYQFQSVTEWDKACPQLECQYREPELQQLMCQQMAKTHEQIEQHCLEKTKEREMRGEPDCIQNLIERCDIVAEQDVMAFHGLQPLHQQPDRLIDPALLSISGVPSPENQRMRAFDTRADSLQPSLDYDEESFNHNVDLTDAHRLQHDASSPHNVYAAVPLEQVVAPYYQHHAQHATESPTFVQPSPTISIDTAQIFRPAPSVFPSTTPRNPNFSGAMSASNYARSIGTPPPTYPTAYQRTLREGTLATSSATLALFEQTRDQQELDWFRSTRDPIQALEEGDPDVILPLGHGASGDRGFIQYSWPL